MKRFISLSLLAIMFSTCVIQPASAFISVPAWAIAVIVLTPKQLNKKEQFGLGFISGMIPVMGQVIAGLSFLNPNPAAKTAGDNISFLAGHALGMSLWTVVPYVESLKHTQNK